MEGSEFLKQKYNLHSAPETAQAAKRTEKRNGTKVPQSPEAQIQNYLDRFKEIADRKDNSKKEHGLTALKKILHEKFVIHRENIPESYFRLQQQIAREQGHGTLEITDKLREESVKVIQADQWSSLDQWIEYLASNDALYPDWTKYWAFRSMLGMSAYDKKKHEFGKRDKNTTAPFPDLNREALAYVVDILEKRKRGISVENPIQEGENAFAEEGKKISDDDFQKLLTTENFARYYAFAIEHVTADNSELYKITEGEWRVFPQGTEDATILTKTLQGHGTGWCTAGEATATAQLQKGDFHVYYSLNDLGEPKIPRLAIRMEGEKIGEVRGVAHKQEIDSYIAPVLEEKLKDFGEQGKEYMKKAEDMKHLTELEEKNNNEELLSSDDLAFLYELKESIEGFGYERDPRIENVRGTRRWLEDMKDLYKSDPSNAVIARSYHEATSLPFGSALRDALIRSGFKSSEETEKESLHSVISYDVSISNLAIWMSKQRRIFVESQCPTLLDQVEIQNNEDLQKEIASKLLETGAAVTLIENLKRFPNLVLDESLALIYVKFESHDDPDFLSFFPLTEKVANELVKKGNGIKVIQHLERLNGIDRNDLAIRMAQWGDSRTVARNIKYFPMVDKNYIYQCAIQEGPLPSPKELGFEHLNEKTALAILAEEASSGSKYQMENSKLEYSLECFDTLSDKTVDAALDMGFKKIRIQSPPFNNLSEETAIRLIRETDNAINTVLRSLHVYKEGINQKKLIDAFFEENKYIWRFKWGIGIEKLSLDTKDYLKNKLESLT